MVQKAPWISCQWGFRLFVPRYYATSRRFRHQRAGVNPYCLVRVQGRARPSTAVLGHPGRSDSASAAEIPAFGRKRRSALPTLIAPPLARPFLLPFALPLPFLLAVPRPLLLPRPLLARLNQLPSALVAALLRLRPLLARRDQLLGALVAALLLPLLLRFALLARRVRYSVASSPRIRLLTRAFSASVIASHIPR